MCVCICVELSSLEPMKSSNFQTKWITVLPPIPTKSLTAADVDDLTRTTRDAMLDALVSVTESPVGQKATQPLVSSKEETRAMKATLKN